MNEYSQKERGSVLAVALSILLIAGFVKLVQRFPTGTDGHDEAVKASLPGSLAHRPAVLRSSPWPGGSYSEVRAYYSREAFKGSFKRGIPDEFDDKDGVLLNAAQERRLISAVTTRATPYTTADCWFPRHAFVFWDPFGKPVAEVDICFACLQVLGGASDVPDVGALADLVSDMGLPLGDDVAAEEFQRRFRKMQEEEKSKEVLGPTGLGEASAGQP